MIAPKPSQLRVEDFADASPEVQAAFAKLFQVLNPTLERTATALSGNLSLSNLRAGTVTASFQTPAAVSASAAPFPIYLAKPFQTRMRHLVVSGVRNLTDSGAVLASAVQPDWQDMGDGRVKVRFLTGLAASTKYELTFLALGD